MACNKVLMKAQDALAIKTLNNVAVEYFELGLENVSYYIWDELFHGIQCDPGKNNELLPIISCNMGNALRKTGYYEEAYRVCWRGLQCCFGTGAIYAVPELLIQLSIIKMKFEKADEAKMLYTLGQKTFLWIRKTNIDQITIEELAEEDFLMYC